MNHADMIRHLTHYAETCIKDLGVKYGGLYLEKAVVLWAEVYGSAVSEQMKFVINSRLEKMRQ